MTNIIVAGGVGTFVAMVLQFCGITSALGAVTLAIRSLVRLSFLPVNIGSVAMSTPPTGLGFAFGCFFCYGSKVGWYHSFFLPIILVEMECGEGSIWGAVDECTLVLVSAGICTANIVYSWLFRKKSESMPPQRLHNSDHDVSLRGLKINLLCGDFIEAAYPFMERSVIVNAFAYLASGVSTEILFRERADNVLGSAYLPVMLSLYLAGDRGRAVLSGFVAFTIAFVGGLIGNTFKGKRHKDEERHKEKDE
uniref:Uncharacterized protein n=1 Tax=Odontella aurita TaxID=265563 RepID=A0A7S4IXA2_9STRA